MHNYIDRKNIHNVKANIICYALCVALIAGLFAFFPGKLEIFGYENKTGRVDVNAESTLNVRTGPGTSHDKLMHNNSSVYLTSGQLITITGEETASDGAKWYKASFVYRDGTTLSGYVHSMFITIVEDIEYKPDADFEAYMTSQGFPESYKPYLRDLHAIYPNWVFQADKIDIDWNEVVENQSKVGRSLVNVNNISSWKSTAPGAYNWETGKWVIFDSTVWVAASNELVAYYLDPRNFLDSTYIFQFTSLSHNSIYETEDNIAKIVKNTFMADGTIPDDNGGTITYVQALKKAASESGVSAFYLASSIIQEIGTLGTSGSISGNYKGIVGIYNYYNWGASSSKDPVYTGLTYASQEDPATGRPWNTRYKSISYGAKKFNNNYISVGQDTMYYKKFDFVGQPYTHQYMTNIQAGAHEGKKFGQGFSEDLKKSSALVFKIPVFKDMPAEKAPIPTKNGSPNNKLKSISVSEGALTPTFSTDILSYDVSVLNNVSSIVIGAEAYDGKAKIEGTGEYTLVAGNNKIEIKVTAENGDERLYAVNVIRKAAEGGVEPPTEAPTEKPTEAPTEAPTAKPTEKPTEAPTVKPTEKPTEAPTVKPTTKPTTAIPTPSVSVASGYRMDSGNKVIFAIAPDTSVDVFRKNLTVKNGIFKLFDATGNEKNGIICTEDVIKIYNNNGQHVESYKLAVTGDTTGDGKVNAKDALAIRKHIMNTKKLLGCYLIAGDANKGNDGVNAKDALAVRKHIMGTAKIK